MKGDDRVRLNLEVLFLAARLWFRGHHAAEQETGDQ